MQARDPVAAFLKKKTFNCPYLGNAKLTEEQCVGRQLREIETKMFGRKILVNNTPFDKFCRSGCCEIGLVHLQRLNPKAFTVRVRTSRKLHKKSPCKPLGEATCTL